MEGDFLTCTAPLSKQPFPGLILLFQVKLLIRVFYYLQINIFSMQIAQLIQIS
jgi:hypothetical protein